LPAILETDSGRARGGGKLHEAADILAPRGTPIVAVEDGVIQKLFLSKAGGLTVYEFDRQGIYCYYYAHLERYAGGLKEGMTVKRGDVIGFVGTTGNAPPQTPHLHFAIFKLGAERALVAGDGHRSLSRIDEFGEVAIIVKVSDAGKTLDVSGGEQRFRLASIVHDRPGAAN